MELDVWTSSKVTHASQDPETKKWTVEIERENSDSRKIVVNHVVFAVGLGGGVPNMPQYTGAVCARSHQSSSVLSYIKHIGGFQRNDFTRRTLHKGKRLRGEKGRRCRRLYIWQVLISQKWIHFHSTKTIGHDIAKDLHDHGVGAPPFPSSFSCPGDQSFFRCDHVPAQFYLHHVRQARCHGCLRRFVLNIL